MIQQVSPDSATTICRYDPNGNLTQSVAASGAVANYTYDALDRVSTVTYPSDSAENVTYTYDQAAAGFGVGRLTAVTDAVGTLNWTYDERGNLLAETRTIGGATLLTAYTYDAAGRPSSITYPSGWTVTLHARCHGTHYGGECPASGREYVRCLCLAASAISLSVP